MTEDQLLRAVLDMARLFGLKTAHFRPARRLDKDGRERWETPVQGDGRGLASRRSARGRDPARVAGIADSRRSTPQDSRNVAGESVPIMALVIKETK